MFPNNANLNVQNPVIYYYKTNKNSFVVFCSLFSKYINPTEVYLFFPTSEHQALIYPLGVLACFLIPILKKQNKRNY